MSTEQDTTSRQSVIVVGAGIIGLATADELINRGREVTVLDDAPVSGATYAAAGMLAPAAEVVWDQDTLYPLMIQASEMYPGFVDGVQERSGQKVGYLRNETLVCAGDAADWENLKELSGLQRKLGLDVSPISSLKARRMEPGLGTGFIGAMYIPGDHQVTPRRLAAALQKIVGDRLLPKRVASVIWSDGVGSKAVGVSCTDGSEFFADEVLVTGGMGAADIEGLPEELNLPLRPVYGEVLRLRVPERLQPILTRTVRGIVHGRPVYMVPRSDGTVVLGATSREDSMSGVSADGVHQLLHDGSQLVPSILECEIYEMTTRGRPGSPDDVPLIGRLADGLSLSNGYFRHGILLTPLGAALGADAVCGIDVDEKTSVAINPFRF